MAFTKALLNALLLSVSNIVLHTPCLVKTCVYNAEATASDETLFNGINIIYMLNITMTIRQYLLPKLSHRKGPEISARILSTKSHDSRQCNGVLLRCVRFIAVKQPRHNLQ